MDRNTITGLALIFLVMIAWGYFSMPSKEERAQMAEQARQDSVAALNLANQQKAAASLDSLQSKPDTLQPNQPAGQGLQQDSTRSQIPANSVFAKTGVDSIATVVIKTPLYRTTFTNKGAGPLSFTLLEHETWDQHHIQMLTDTLRSAYTLGFLTTGNFNVETRNILFKQATPQNKIQLEEGETAQLKYVLPVSQNKRIVYTYTFYGDSYSFDLNIHFEGLKQTIIGQTVEFGFASELAFTEKRVERDANSASAYVYTGGEMLRMQLSEPGHKEESYNGEIDWVSTRTQFFAQIIKSKTPTSGAELLGTRTATAERAGVNFDYETYLRTPIPDSSSIQFGLYLGPLSAQSLDQFAGSAYSMVDVGYSWTSWFSEPLVRWVILPFFDFTSGFMNVGLAIILFGILIKLVLYPLTRKSFKSMAAMKELQPEMKKIQEKFKDDPKRQQKETMKLYKKAGANPLGGCMPMLLQFPILITLWRFFQHSILIRQEAFLWATDLSAPDYIINLPFSIPFIGDQLAGFVLLMTVTMVIQSKVTGGMGGAPAPGGGDAAGAMKMMQYIFPVMMLFIFNNFAAGLSLYYLVYNVMSIAQQMLINKQMEASHEVEKALAK